MAESRTVCPFCKRLPGESHRQGCSRYRQWYPPRDIRELAATRTYLFPPRTGMTAEDLPKLRVRPFKAVRSRLPPIDPRRPLSPAAQRAQDQERRRG